MNKKELLEELEKETNDYAEIRINKGIKLPEEIEKDFQRVRTEIGKLEKLAEELLRPGFLQTWLEFNEQFGIIGNRLEDLADTITVTSADMEDNETVADTVEVTDRKDEKQIGVRYHAVIIS